MDTRVLQVKRIQYLPPPTITGYDWEATGHHVYPSAVHTLIPVPHHWKKRVKEDLDRDVKLGIIEPVPAGTPTICCSRMVVAPKKAGSPRRTVDLQKLNAATMRETHHTPSPFNQVSIVPARTKKTVLDAWNWYHSLPLSPTARDATTFITKWCRYQYLRAPQGFNASGDGYTRQFDDITVDIPAASTTLFSGMRPRSLHSGIHWTTLPTVAEMELYLIPTSSTLQAMRSSSLAS